MPLCWNWILKSHNAKEKWWLYNETSEMVYRHESQMILLQSCTESPTGWTICLFSKVRLIIGISFHLSSVEWFACKQVLIRWDGRCYCNFHWNSLQQYQIQSSIIAFSLLSCVCMADVASVSRKLGAQKIISDEVCNFIELFSKDNSDFNGFPFESNL